MGSLSQLIVANSAKNVPDALDEFDPLEPVVLSELKPDAEAMAAVEQIVLPPDTERTMARAAVDGDVVLAASDQAQLKEVTNGAAEPGASANLVAVPAERMSHEALQLAALLRMHDWRDELSDDPSDRGVAEARMFYMRRLIRQGNSRGNEEEMRQVWSQFADKLAPSFEAVQQRERLTAKEPMHLPVSAKVAPRAANKPIEIDGEFTQMGMSTVPLRTFDPAPELQWPKRPTPSTPPPAPPSSNGAKATVQQNPSGEGGGGGGGPGIGEILKAPFTLAMKAGSLAIAAAGAVGTMAQQTYVRSRINGHSVLASQLDGHANAVVELSSKLRQQGMGDLVDAIQRTGDAPSVVISQMHTGGKYDALGKKYDRLMSNPEVAKTFGEMKTHMDQFDLKARRYAKTGIDLNLDHDTPIQKGTDAMMAATAGMPTKDGGAFKQIQEGLKEMAERIMTMVRNLFSRLVPG